MPEKPGRKEPETAQTFDVDSYRDELIEQGYSDASAKMLSEKKKEKLDNAPAPVVKFEIDLSELLEKGKSRQKVLVNRGGKTFYREQMVGHDDEEKKVVPKVAKKKVVPKVAKKKVEEKKEEEYMPTLADVDYDWSMDYLKECIDNSKADTMDDIDELGIRQYIAEQTPEEWSLQRGTGKLKDVFEDKLYDMFVKKYMKGRDIPGIS